MILGPFVLIQLNICMLEIMNIFIIVIQLSPDSKVQFIIKTSKVGEWLFFSLYYFVLNKENKSYLNLFVHLLVERNPRHHQSHYLTKKSHYFGGWLVVKVIIMKIIIIDAKVSLVYFYVVNIFIYLFILFKIQSNSTKYSIMWAHSTQYDWA